MKKEKPTAVGLLLITHLLIFSVVSLFPASSFADTAKREGPRLKAPVVFAPRRDAQVEEARAKAIESLLQLIRRTPREHPDLPEFLSRLAEMYWEEGDLYFRRAMKREGASEAAAREAEMRRASDAQGRAVKIYERIVKSFPSYKRLDEVLYFLGYAYQELGRIRDAEDRFREILRDIPTSDYAPDALMALAEHAWSRDQLKLATEMYQKLVAYGEGPLYGFALYKLAWCAYNRRDYRQTIDYFLQAIRHGEKAGDPRLELIKEAKKDLVTAVSRVATGAGAAEAFFRRVGGDGLVRDSLPRLAELFYGQGRFAEALAIYRRLANDEGESADGVNFAAGALQCAIALGDRARVVSEVAMLGARWKKIRANVGEPTRSVVAKRLENTIRDLAVVYHREGDKLKNDDILGLATAVYGVYLDAFAEGERAAEMRFFFGEALFRTGQNARAAEEYTKVVDANPAGPRAAAAAYGAVVALDRALGRSDRPLRVHAPGKRPPPVPLPPGETRLREACERYLVLIPKDAATERPGVLYRLGRLFYDFHQIDDAARRYGELVGSYPSHALASAALGELLDCMNTKGDLTGVEEWGRKALANAKLIRRGGALEREVRRIVEQAMLKRAESLAQGGQARDAARMYEAFAKEFPRSELLDRALLNGAAAYETAREVEAAQRLRALLVRKRASSELAPAALWAQGESFVASLRWADGAAAWESLAGAYPKFKKAGDALVRAGYARRAAGDLKRAVDDWERALKAPWASSITPKTKSRIVEVLLRTLEDTGEFRRIIRVAQTVRQSDGLDAVTRRAVLVALGRAKLEVGEAAQADDLLLTALKPRAETGDAAEADLDLIARAKLVRAEVRRKLAEGTTLASTTMKKLTRELTEKSRLVTEARALYADAVGAKRPRVAVEALAKVGDVLQFFAKQILAAPVPKGLTGDQVREFRAALEAKVLPIEEKAADAYRACLKVVAAGAVYDRYAERCVQGHAQFVPGESREVTEVVPTLGRVEVTVDGRRDEIARKIAAASRDEDVTAHYRAYVALALRDKRPSEALAAARAGLLRLRAAAKAGVSPTDAGTEALEFGAGLARLDLRDSMGAVAHFQAGGEAGALALGVMALRAGDAEGAEAAFRRAGRKSEAVSGLGIARRVARRLDEARSTYQEALTMDPSNAIVLYNLGVLEHDYAKRPAEALEIFKRVSAAAEGLPSEKKKEVEARIQRLMEQKGRGRTDVIEVARRCLNLEKPVYDPHNPRLNGSCALERESRQEPASARRRPRV
ncbi:MAG: tetratricopeptide repeat protein [Deltaproteobacteria bacterium]|nr:tetratricopeptide repeat protein [Deltaproteobacteria bacterium]